MPALGASHKADVAPGLEFGLLVAMILDFNYPKCINLGAYRSACSSNVVGGCHSGNCGHVLLSCIPEIWKEDINANTSLWFNPLSSAL